MKNQKRGNNKTKAKNGSPKEFIVENPSGLLDFLLMTQKNKSRNNVKSMLSRGQVRVDNRVVKQFDFVLKSGQKITISQTLTKDKTPKLIFDIIFEDEDFIVINKPSGLLSIASDTEKEVTAFHMLMEYVRFQNPQNRVFVIHRLDRDTSGVFMVAKNEKTKLALQDNWNELVTFRGYYAVVEGHLENESGTIKTYLKQTKTMLMYSADKKLGGLEAITNYKVIRESENFSLVDVDIETGRKNQIRVHMKELGNCVVGDKKYGSKINPIKRLALHAYNLSFKHPFTQQTISFEAPMPKSFKTLLDERY